MQNLCIQHIFTPQTMNANGQPSEYAFQAEFITIFKSLLLQAYAHLKYRVLPEVKERDNGGKRRQRLDILVRDSAQPAYGFELVVAANKQDRIRRPLRPLCNLCQT